jgi:hypothetical protein
MDSEMFKRNMFIDIPEKCPMTELAYGKIKSHGKLELLGKRNVRIIEVKNPETKIIVEGGWFFHPLDLLMPGTIPAEPVPIQIFDPENLSL